MSKRIIPGHISELREWTPEEKAERVRRAKKLFDSLKKRTVGLSTEPTPPFRVHLNPRAEKPAAFARTFVELTLPLRTVNETNGGHGHWTTVAARRKKERLAVRLVFGAKLKRFVAVPVRVTLTRIGRNTRPMDFSGLVASFKAIQDEVAALLGRDDADKSIRWEYAQERAKAYAVRVRVQEWEAE